MNLTRKLLRAVDLRVHHYMAGQSSASSRLGRVHSIESLAWDHSSFKSFCPVEKTAKNSL